MSDIFRILFAIEMRLFLRNKLALFWMVVFPILLFAILYGAFGGPSSLGSLTLQTVDLDRSSRSEAFLNFLHRGLADNRSVDVAIVPAADSGPVARDALRLTIPRGFDRAFGESGVSTVTVAPGPGDTIAQHAVIGMVLGLNTEFNSMAGHVPQRSRIVVSKSPIVNDLGYGQYLTVGVVVMTIISTCLMGFTTPIVALRENGILKTYSAMPISKPVFMAALLTSRVILVVAFTALFLLAVRFVFGVEIPILAGGLLKGLLFVTLAVCTFLAVGLIVAGRVGSVATASAVTSAIYFPLVFLSNLVIPFNDFPGWIRSVLDDLPSTLAATMLRDGLFRLDGGGADWHAAGLLGIWAVAASVVALKTFRWNAR